MAFTISRPSGAILFGVVNELSAQWRDGKLGATTSASELEGRKKVYITLVGTMIVGVPLWASWSDGFLVEIGEGVFDGLAAIVARNVTMRVAQSTPVPPHTPL